MADRRNRIIFGAAVGFFAPSLGVRLIMAMWGAAMPTGSDLGAVVTTLVFISFFTAAIGAHLAVELFGSDEE
jgi:hypothetical protein